MANLITKLLVFWLSFDKDFNKIRTWCWARGITLEYSLYTNASWLEYVDVIHPDNKIRLSLLPFMGLRHYKKILIYSLLHEMGHYGYFSSINKEEVEEIKLFYIFPTSYADLFAILKLEQDAWGCAEITAHLLGIKLEPSFFKCRDYCLSLYHPAARMESARKKSSAGA